MAWLQPIRDVLLEILLGSRCAACGGRGEGTPCQGCIAEVHATPPTTDAAFADHGAVARLVRAAKDGRWRRGGTCMAPWVVARWRAARPGSEQLPTLVTWVPADARRTARRGYYLPEAIARRIGEEIGADAALLLRRRRRPPQRGLDRAGRIANARDAFALLDTPAARRSAGGHVLLVDDVRTTGATLDACADQLRSQGARVEVYAIAGVGEVPAPVPRADGVGAAQGDIEEWLTNRTVPADTTRHRSRKARRLDRTPSALDPTR